MEVDPRLGPFSELVQEVIAELGSNLFFREKNVSCGSWTKMTLEVFFCAWWMKIQSFGRVEGRVFFLPLSKSVSPNKKGWFFEGQRCRRHMYRLWLIKFGQAASVAESMPLWLVFCEIRTIHNSWQVMHNDTVVHQVVSPCSEAIHSDLSYPFGVVATNVLQVLKLCLRAVQPFQEGPWEHSTGSLLAQAPFFCACVPWGMEGSERKTMFDWLFFMLVIWAYSKYIPVFMTIFLFHNGFLPE